MDKEDRIRLLMEWSKEMDLLGTDHWKEDSFESMWPHEKTFHHPMFYPPNINLKED